MGLARQEGMESVPTAPSFAPETDFQTGKGGVCREAGKIRWTGSDLC